MTIHCACGHEYATKGAPCPDGREGCLVHHTIRGSYACEKCGADNVPDLSKGISVEIGIGLINMKGLEKLELFTKSEEEQEEIARALGVPEKFWSNAEPPFGGESLLPDVLKFEAYSDEDKERLYAGLGVPKEFLEGSTEFSSTAVALRGYPPRDFNAQYQQQPPPIEPRDVCVCLHHADQHKWLNDPAPLRSRHLRCTVCDCGHFKERE